MKQKQLTQAETAEFCTSLALLLHSGLGLADSLWILAREGSQMQTDLARLLDTGATLSLAMEETGGYPAYAVAMIRIGEETGRLEETLEALGAYYLENTRTARQLKHTLAYPAMILLLMTVMIESLHRKCGS